MAVTVRRGLWRELRAQETVLLYVRSPQPDRLRTALPPAVAEVAAIDAGWQSVPGLAPGDKVGPAYVSAPIPVPDGWLLLVDFDSLPLPVRRAAVERMVARLDATPGIPDADVGPAPPLSDRYEAVFGFSPVARAPLLGRAGRPSDPPDRPPSGLVGASLRWLRERGNGGPEPVALIMSTELPVSWPELPRLIDTAYPAAGLLTVISTDFATVQASVTYGAFHGAGAVLSMSRAAAQAADVAADMRSQRDMIRAHVTELAWAGVDLEANGQIIISPSTKEYDGAEPYPLWFQVLTAEQIRHLGGPPDGGVPLPDGRVELTVGDPDQWVPGHPDQEAVRDRARRLLNLAT